MDSVSTELGGGRKRVQHFYKIAVGFGESSTSPEMILDSERSIDFAIFKRFAF